MNLFEIINIPSRDEYHNQFLSRFNKAEKVAEIQGKVLRLYVDEYSDRYYGLFDQDNLIAYLQLCKEGQCYQVLMQSTLNQYRGQGWITYLFDYAVLHDKLKLVSDDRQTKAAKNVWKSLARNGRYDVFIWDRETNEKTLLKSDDDSPWNDLENPVLIIEYNEQRFQSLIEHTKKRIEKGIDPVTLYGPGTTDVDFWNP